MSLADRVRTLPGFADRYDLGELVGVGGMGEVYRATSKPLGRVVAIKFLSPELATKDDRYRERFLREARLASSLVHASVVAVFEFGMAGEIPYLVSEFVDGRPLSRLMCDRPRLEAPVVLSIAYQILDGLAAIHRLDIVHRDIKPENILVMKGDPLTLKIADFGLAKQSSVDDGLHTAAGVILGTPSFMAPEQATGTPLSPATDLYCFSLILYMLVVGRHPFSTGVGYQMIRRQISEEARLPPELLPGLRQVLTRGLAKPAADRFQSAGELKEALARLEPAIAAAQGFSTSPGRRAPPGDDTIVVARVAARPEVTAPAQVPRPVPPPPAQAPPAEPLPRTAISPRPSLPHPVPSPPSEHPAGPGAIGALAVAGLVLAVATGFVWPARPGASRPGPPSEARVRVTRPELSWASEIKELLAGPSSAASSALVRRLGDGSTPAIADLADPLAPALDDLLLDLLEAELKRSSTARAMARGDGPMKLNELFGRVGRALGARPVDGRTAVEAIREFFAAREREGTSDARCLPRGNALDQLEQMLVLGCARASEELVLPLRYLEIVARREAGPPAADWARATLALTLKIADLPLDTLAPLASDTSGAWPLKNRWPELSNALDTFAGGLSAGLDAGPLKAAHARPFFRQSLLLSEIVIHLSEKLDRYRWPRGWDVPAAVKVVDLRPIVSVHLLDRLTNDLGGDGSVAVDRGMPWRTVVELARRTGCSEKLIERITQDGQNNLLD